MSGLASPRAAASPDRKPHPVQWRPVLLALLVGALFYLAWWRLSSIYQGRLISEQRAELESRLDDVSSLLTSDINRRQAQLVGLAAAVRSHTLEDLQSGHFNDFAAGLSANDPVVRTVQFFPAEGEVLVYPRQGNEITLGSTLADLMATNRANVREDVRRAIESREITLSNPYELRQGGLGVVARLAVFAGDELTGLVVIILDVNSLLQLPGLEGGSPEIRLALQDSVGQVFFGSDDAFLADPVTETIVLPEGHWTLGAVPLDGWAALVQTGVNNFRLIGLLPALLLVVLSYQICSSQETLKRAVSERTADLAASEERYATALRLVNEGVWDWDLESGTGSASENAYTLLGFEKIGPSLPVEQFFLHVDPADQERVREAIRRGAESGAGFDVEMRMVRPNGEWVFVLARGRVVDQDRTGRPLRLVGVISDITERKQAEARLREEQAKFQALFQNNHAPMLLVRPEDGQIVEANLAACGFYGWTHAELTAKNISQINILGKAQVLAEMERAAREHSKYFQFRHRLASGEIRDVEVFSGPIESDGARLLYSIVHDVTSRKRAEQALAESEERYRQLLELAPVSILVYAQGSIQYVNPAAVRLFGAGTTAELVGGSLESILPPADLAEASERIKQLEAGGAPAHPIRLVLRRLDGSEVDAEISVAPMVFQGRPAIQAVATDISPRIQAEKRIRETQARLQNLLAEADESRGVLLSVIEDQKIAEEKLSQLNAQLEQRVAERTAQLEAANKELEAFSYSVSHDLRAPLRGVDGWSLALLEDCGPQLDERGRGYIERVRAETRRMGDLIDDLLRLSRVARVEMKRTSVPLSEMAGRIAGRLCEENPTRPVELVIQPDLSAAGDEQLFEIMLTNLLSNAFKFTGKLPEARIEFGQLEQAGEQVFYVRDNGAGFEMAFAKNLFGAFQRMHKQAEFPGNGVGLATVQRIVNRHGGRIWAEAAKNQGAAFYFTLPGVQ